MVHSFKYKYQTKTHYFLWDSESGSLHNVDYTAFLIAKNMFRQELFTEDKHAFESIDKVVAQETEAELNELKLEGALDSPCDVFQSEKAVGEIKALCLHVCHDCNLRCRYCFADEGTYRTRNKEFLTLEVGIKAIDFLIARSGKRTNLEVDFFGGEPLMNLDVVKGVVEYARHQEKLTGKKFNFTMTTNCVLLDEKNIEWLNKEMHNVVLSIDGRKEVNDAVRKTPNGKGSFDVVLKNAQAFRAVRGDKSYYVRGTFTARNLDFSKDVLALSKLGFDQISVEPVVTDIEDLKIKEEHLPQIVAEYEKLATQYLEARSGDGWFNFFHFMIDLSGGPCVKKRLTGCGSGCEYLSVTPNGNIYPCHQFAEKPEYLMGSVLDNTLDLGVSAIFARNIVTNKHECDNCFAKYYCSGGCVANNLNFAGDMNIPYKITCAMMKKRLELSLAIAAIEGSR